MTSRSTSLLTIILSGVLILSGFFYKAYGQEDWILKEEKEGISIFTRNFPDSKFKAIRVKCELKATLSQFVAAIMDVNTGVQWVYSTKSSVLLKQVSPSELYYYSEVSIPWPLSNRDFIAHLKVTQDPVTRIVTIYGPTVPDYLPVRKGIVRVAHSEGRWIITPLAANLVKVEYTLRTDPGGTVPTWMVNLFATKGPLESFRNLKIQLQKPVYVNAHLPYIKD
jgi:hypothetical protein